MKKIILLTATLMLSSNVNAATIVGGSGLSGADVNIDFSEVALPNSTSLTNQFNSFGVTFTGGWFMNGCIACVTTSPSGAKPDIGNFDYNNTGSTGIFNSNIGMLFSDIATDISFSTAFNGGNHSISAYLNNSLVESFLLPSSWGTVGFTGIQFNELRMTASAAFLLDDLKFNTTNVPEPTSIALLGLGLAGLGFSRKNKAA